MIADDIWSTDGVHDQGYDQNAGTVKKPDGTPISTGAKSEEKKESADKDQKSDDSKKEDNKSSDSSKSDSKGDSSQSKQNSGSSQGSSGNNSSSNGGSQKKWVAEQGHWETDYSQVWVPNVVYTRHPRFWVNHGGTMVAILRTGNCASRSAPGDRKIVQTCRFPTLGLSDRMKQQGSKRSRSTHL